MSAVHQSFANRRMCAPRRMLPQHGLTLVELMIALGLGLLLVAGVGAVYLGSNQTYRVAQEGARIQESGRYALDVIGRSLRQAGYAPVGFSGTVTVNPISGTNGASDAPDVLTTQRGWNTGDRSCVSSSGAANQIVQESFNVDTANAELQCDGVIASTPTTPAGGQPLLSGVEDLQILYGRDTDTPADYSANLYDPQPDYAVEWGQVVSVRACVLVHSENEGVAPDDSYYFNCKGALGREANDAERFSSNADTRLRRAFVATFALRNRIKAIP
jgi:type IV pilus assembly protein PilW